MNLKPIALALALSGCAAPGTDLLARYQPAPGDPPHTAADLAEIEAYYERHAATASLLAQASRHPWRLRYRPALHGARLYGTRAGRHGAIIWFDTRSGARVQRGTIAPADATLHELLHIIHGDDEWKVLKAERALFHELNTSDGGQRPLRWRHYGAPAPVPGPFTHPAQP